MAATRERPRAGARFPIAPMLIRSPSSARSAGSATQAIATLIGVTTTSADGQ